MLIYKNTLFIQQKKHPLNTLFCFFISKHTKQIIPYPFQQFSLTYTSFKNLFHNNKCLCLLKPQVKTFEVVNKQAFKTFFLKKHATHSNVFII